MSVYLGYDTITKQYLKDLISNNQKPMTEWTNYYANVSSSMTYPHGLDNFPCPVRNDEITENTNIVVKTLSFDDVPFATLNKKTLDVKARFVRPDKSVVVKDLVSIDLSTPLSLIAISVSRERKAAMILLTASSNISLFAFSLISFIF